MKNCCFKAILSYFVYVIISDNLTYSRERKDAVKQMTKRTDLKKILIIGSGPIIIGQACEFDYSGTQACKALRGAGYEIVLVNSNPATIMTDPGMADHTYIEPLTAQRLEQIIAKEKPDALLPNLGGQTALNLSSELHEKGILAKYNVKVIGVDLDAIKRGEDRIEFKKTMAALGVPVPHSEPSYTVEEAEAIADKLGYPVVLRPAYTMGGTGGGIVYNVEELRQVMTRGLAASLIGQVLVEECVLGWEELELEVVRDAKGQKITVCFIENVDPMGVHTGDSFCVAPMLTVPKEVQERLQDYAYRIVDAVGVTGGTNVQFGGQTPLNLAQELKDNGVNIIGTQPEGIRLAEDREYFRERMIKLGIPQPESGCARSLDQAVALAAKIGYPVMVRPSFVLGGRGMEVIYDEEMLKKYAVESLQVSPEFPMLIDRFLDNAIECEVDAVSDGTDTFVASIMEHIELAGIHSGDSACVIPPVTIPEKHQETIRKYTAAIALDFKVMGIMNVQYAICEDKVYIIEANPRASRTVPVISKVTGVPLAKLATQLMLGKKLGELGTIKVACDGFYGVKEAVFPFNMFPEVDPVLGPEMRATGEVMGLADCFGVAYYKAEEAAGFKLPTAGKVLISVARRERKYLLPIAQHIHELGFEIFATEGTSKFLTENGIPNTHVKKLLEGRPNIGDMIKNKQLNLIFNTPVGREGKTSDSYIRMMATQHKIPYMTTIAAANATVKGIQAVLHNKDASPKSLQEYHEND